MRRILALDGGGIKGVFPAAFLAAIEETIEGNVGDYFDLIVGTSTGGIIALGLGVGMSAKDLLNFYEQYGPQIFSKSQRRGFFSKLIKAKYNPKSLQEALEECFGDLRLGECKTRIVIPSQNLIDGGVYVYKTAHHEKLQMDYKRKIVEVARATSAAPTYFPTFTSEHGIPMVDGGMGANNPTGLSVVEAIGILNWNPEELRVLSIGCTSTPFSVQEGDKGLLSWSTKIVDTFMTAQSFYSLGTASLLVGSDNVFRISPIVSEKDFSLDGVEQIDKLEALGQVWARDSIPKLKKVFFQEKAQSFEPFYELNRHDQGA